MKWQSLVIDGFARVLEILEPALEGLNKEELSRQAEA